ncbi:MAG TPA: lysophospholipid acyltransferase family protein [Candidatus Gastranaerophilales bacterium]|nr:lysophospholipid acyltransferase family protein [Candidatus Gastranaerophilales bacterium]
MLKNLFNKNDAYYDSKGGLIFQKVIVTLFLRPYYQIFFRMEVEGAENIPKNQASIFASTHISYHDPPLLASATQMHMAYMAKKELFEVPVLSQIINALGAFPVNRQKLEIKTLKTAKRIIASKRWNLGIFPQGTRIMDGSLEDVKPGFSHLAKATRSTVVPVYLDYKKGRFPFYGKVTVKIGKPLPPSENAEEIHENWKKAVSGLAGREYIKQASLENDAKVSV